MAGAEEEFERELYRFPSFLERLEAEGAIDVREVVTSETEIDGIVYHHRGVQVPAHTAMFAWEPPTDDSSPPRFSIESATVGPRSAWATFDATRDWDVYLLLFEGGAVVAWMTDAEFEAEEAEHFPSKAAAIRAGQFSFGAIFRFGPDWVERIDWAEESTAPAMIQLGDGRLLMPETEHEFHDHPEAIPVELRLSDPAAAPEHLGLVDVEISIRG